MHGPLMLPPRCPRAPFGWACSMLYGHAGPCPTWPAWWNFPARRRMRQAQGRTRR